MGKTIGSKVIGAPLRRVEDERLVTGQGRFVADVTPEDCLHVAFVRSPHARADVTGIDAETARGEAGVIAIVVGDDVAHVGDLPVNPLVRNLRVPRFPILAHGSVMAVGEPVAAVVAETAAAALDAAELVEVDYAPRDPVLDTLNGNGASLFDTVPENTALWQHWESDDADAAMAAAETVVHVAIDYPRLSPAPLEPRATVARWDEHDGRLTVWLSTQTPHRARTDLADMLGLDEAAIRVIAPDVGGAFGMKASLFPEDVLVAWAARTLKRPVKWTGTRAEDLLAATHGRGIKTEGELAVSDDGRMLALKARVRSEHGHWLPFSGAVPGRNAARILPGPYVVEAVDVDLRGHLTNRTPVGIYRGAGRPEAAMLMERLVDTAARRLGMDPAELRRRNLVRAEAMPYDTPTGETLDSGDYAAALDRACEVAQYARLRQDQTRRREAGELVGIGIAFYVEPCGQGWESARIRLDADGSVVAATGSSAQGQGRETGYAQIVADTLDMPPDRITVVHGDTETSPKGIGALASRSTPIGGSAMLDAARKLREMLDAGASGPLEADAIAEVPKEAWGYGCAVASVAIDRDTGVTTIERIVWIDDAGTVINPALVEGQLIGGIAQGIGEALMERIVYDDDGQLLTGSLMDYALPRARDMPPMTFERRETPTPLNALGAKGIGESGTIGAPAAIVNAVVDALSPMGVAHIDLPMTSETIWRAIAAAEKE